VSKRQQQRNEQILHGLLKYISFPWVVFVFVKAVVLIEGNLGMGSVRIVLRLIRVGQVIISVHTLVLFIRRRLI
jgi:hypothetical protein